MGIIDINREMDVRTEEVDTGRPTDSYHQRRI